MQVSTNGGRISLNLTPSVRLSNTARISCALHSAQIWYTIPNISAEIGNNTLRFTVGVTEYNLVFEKGLYSVESINSAINDFVINNGLINNLFVLDPDVSTSKISLKINDVGVTVFFSDVTSVGQILGFNADVGPSVTAGLIYESPNIATLNSLTAILVEFSQCISYFESKGGSQILASIVPNVGVGSLINYEPSNLIECPMITPHIDKITVSLLNEGSGQVIDTNGEFFSLVILLYEDTE